MDPKRDLLESIRVGVWLIFWVLALMALVVVL